jgi:hypothetical protein
MHSNGSSYDLAGGKPRKRWVCATRNKERFFENYDNLTGYQYNRLLLRRRRAVALRRRGLKEAQTRGADE